MPKGFAGPASKALPKTGGKGTKATPSGGSGDPGGKKGEEG